MTKDKHKNPLRPGIHIDELTNTATPYKVYGTLRDHYPVCLLEPNGYWAISRHEDVYFACRNPGLFSSKGVESLLQPDWMPEDCIRDLFVLTRDPPEHRPRRRILDAIVGSKLLEVLAPAMRRCALQRIEKINPSQEVNFLAEFAQPYIETFVNKIVGSEKDQPSQELAKHPERTNKNIGSPPSKQYIEDQLEGLRKTKSYFHALIQERKQCPRNDLISSLLSGELDGQPLSDDMIFNAAELVSLAGTQGPIILLCHAMIRLGRQPELLQALVKKPDLIPAFIEELLRHVSVAPAVLRKTTVDITLSGVKIPKDAIVLLLFAAANRDPRVFHDPDTFNISRENINQHLAFGFGPHYCLGAALTRLEVKIALEVILSRFHNISCPPDNKIQWNNSWMANSMSSLPIQFK